MSKSVGEGRSSRVGKRDDLLNAPPFGGRLAIYEHVDSITHGVLVVAKVESLLDALQREHVGDHLTSVHNAIQGHLNALLKVAAHVNVAAGLRRDNGAALPVQFEKVKVLARADAAWAEKIVTGRVERVRRVAEKKGRAE